MFKVGDIVKIGTILDSWNPQEEEYWKGRICRIVSIDCKVEEQYPISVRDSSGNGRSIGFMESELILCPDLGQYIFSD